MRLDFGFLADYAAPGNNGKLTIIGIFDIVYDQQGKGKVPLPLCYLVLKFSASIVEGSEHKLRIRLSDADGKDQIKPLEVNLAFQPQGPGRPMASHFVMALAGLTVPSQGEYNFAVFVDGGHIADVPLYVVPRREA